MERSAHNAPVTRVGSLGPVPVEPLSEGLDRDLVRLDELLQQHVAQAPIPRQLADLVYDATVGWIWQRAEPLQLEAYRRRTARQTAWGRLAMAAAVTLVFMTAARFLAPTVPAGRVLASISQPADLDVERILFEGTSLSDFDRVDYLLETRDLTFNELAGDLATLAQELEM